MKKKPLISHEAAQRSLEDALRLRVGHGRRYSFDALAEEAGIPSRTLRSYVSEGATPGLSTFLNLCSVLGASFTSDVLAATGQAAQSTETAEPDYMGVLQVMGQGTAKIAEAMADGRVDHRERADIAEFFKDVSEHIQTLAQCDKTIPIKGGVK